MKTNKLSKIEESLYKLEGLCPFADKCNIDERGSFDCIYNYEDCKYYQLYLKER